VLYKTIVEKENDPTDALSTLPTYQPTGRYLLWRLWLQAGGAVGIPLFNQVVVGRQPEMDMLHTALDDVLTDRGWLTILAGEPGIGKTRIAQELTTLAKQRGAQVLWRRCYQASGAPPYWPWAQAIHSYLQECDDETLREVLGTRVADIAAVIPAVHEHFPGVSRSPRIEDPTQARFRLFDAITTFLINASQRQPLVLVLDNMHWADEPALRL